MKYFFPVLMAFVILAGFLLATTPYIAEYFYPSPQNMIKKARPEEAVAALQRWFDSPKAQFVDVQALQKLNEGKRRAYFSFSVERAPVEHFISTLKLTQKELTSGVMEQLFKDTSVSWWHPEALERKTYFTGVHSENLVNLIYNAETQRGVLLISTP
jgi:hypothetical protein